jgi:hypothetical protein
VLLKASPTQYLSDQKATASDSSFARPSEQPNEYVYQALQSLEPRPEPDPRSPTPPNLASNSTRSSFLVLTPQPASNGHNNQRGLCSPGLTTTEVPSTPSRTPTPAMRLRGSGTISPLSDKRPYRNCTKFTASPIFLGSKAGKYA